MGNFSENSKSMTGNLYQMYITCGTDKKMHTKFWYENLKGKDNSQDQDINGKII